MSSYEDNYKLDIYKFRFNVKKNIDVFSNCNINQRDNFIFNKKDLLKKLFKILGGIILGIGTSILVFIAIFYVVFNQKLPAGKIGSEADNLAIQMRNSLNYEAYLNTNYLAWTFNKKRQYEWFKTEGRCIVIWKNIKVHLDLKKTSKSKVFMEGNAYSGEKKQEYIKKALAYFNNDSFWLVAPFKVFDKGVERRLIELKNDEKALLVTYTSGGTTPGDSYLWRFDEKGSPKSYQMWVNLIPVKGLEASWENWVTTKSKVKLATLHEILFYKIQLTELNTSE